MKQFHCITFKRKQVLSILTLILLVIIFISMTTSIAVESIDYFISPLDRMLLFGSNNKFIAPIEPYGDDSIKIYTVQELININDGLNKSYVLMNDIDLSDFNDDNSWVPIGYTIDDGVFTGVFDGQGFVIKNYSINGYYKYVGLFGQVNNATIKNLGIEDFHIITNYSSTDVFAGGIVGYGDATFINCYSNGNIDITTFGFAGGILGASYNTDTINIDDCYNKTKINVSISESIIPPEVLFRVAGGLIGCIDGNENTFIRNCINQGEISLNNPGTAGGIIGRKSGDGHTYITSSFNEANVAINNSGSAGGIIGTTSGYNTLSISDCYNVGDVEVLGDGNVGGISGVGSGLFMNSFSASNLSADTAIGGIVGHYTSDSISINNCYWNVDCEQIQNGIKLLNNEKKRVGLGNGIDTSSSLTSDQMLDINNYSSNFGGFDFVEKWEYKGDYNFGYPVLRAKYNNESLTQYSVFISSIGDGASNDGLYYPGDIVELNAGISPIGMHFEFWSSESIGEYLSDISDAQISFIMPDHDVYINAIFIDNLTLKYNVSVLSIGSNPYGDGVYEKEEVVVIDAGNPPTGYHFVEWTTSSIGVSILDLNKSLTSFIMPSNDVVIEALFEKNSIPSYEVIVSSIGMGSSGSGIYKQGDLVEIKAGSPPIGYSFNNWSSISNGVIFGSTSDSITLFIMPPNAVYITANFNDISNNTKKSQNTPQAGTPPSITITDNNIPEAVIQQTDEDINDITQNTEKAQNAQTPIILNQSQNIWAIQDSNIDLSVNASVTDGGNITYQWYQNTINKNVGGTPTSGAMNANYSPPSSTLGIFYYYVTITNTNPNATGKKIISVKSKPITLNIINKTLNSDSDLNGIVLNATLTPIGVYFDWNPSDNKFGFRIYRSNESGKEGVSISVSPIIGSSYFDTKIKSNTHYYYTIAEIVDTNPEIIGPISDEIEIIMTIDEDDYTKDKGFIILTINDQFMQVNDDIVEIDPGRGTYPLLLNNRTMIPIRAVVEAKGGEVYWYENESKIEISLGDRTVTMWLNQTDYMIDGSIKRMDVKPFLFNDRTMLPLRFVLEGFGDQVEWIGSVNKVVIVYQM